MMMLPVEILKVLLCL